MPFAVSRKNQINVADAKTEMQTEQSIYGFRGTTAAILSLLLYIWYKKIA